MFETDTEKAQQIQSDVLLEKTSDNPNFVYNKLAAKNKSLDTSDKRIVGAINELLKKQNSLQSAVQTSINQSFDATGDIISDPELLERLRAVSPNLIEAVCDHEEKINTLQELVEELKKKSGNSNSGSQVINIGGASWDFGEDDMGNLNALLNVTGKNIKEYTFVSPSSLKDNDIVDINNIPITILPGRDLKAVLPDRIRNLTFYNSDPETEIKVYPNLDNIDMDSNNQGQRVIPCVPEVGYYSTRGIPNFIVSVEEKQQIYGIVALGNGNFVRIDKDYNEVPFIVESTNLYTNIKTVTYSPLGTFSEFPIAWVKTEILEEGPYEGKICYWLTDRETDGFHIHTAFLRPDGTAGKLQISSYMMQTGSPDISKTPAYVSAAIDKGWSLRKYNELADRLAAINEKETTNNKWQLYNIWHHSLIGRMMLIEYGTHNIQSLRCFNNSGGNGNPVGTYRTRMNWHEYYDVFGSYNGGYEPAGSTIYKTGAHVDGLKCENETVYIVSNDGEYKDTGIAATGKTRYPKDVTKTGTVNGINFDDLFIDASDGTSSSSANALFGTQGQNFYDGSTVYMGINVGPFQLTRYNPEATGTNAFAYRIARVLDE